jgi:tetratricopeptide (TPR) repeat protein
MATYHRGRTKQAAALAETALQLADESGDARAMAKAHTMLGILENSFEHRRTARDHLSRSLELVDGLHDPEGRIAALQNLAVVSRQDDAGEAERLTREALQLAIAQGDRHREAVLHNALADILHGGDADGAMAHLKQAVAIYAEIGVEAGAVRPEVWKLTEW